MGRWGGTRVGQRKRSGTRIGQRGAGKTGPSVDGPVGGRPLLTFTSIFFKISNETRSQRLRYLLRK